jgi:hypothetical protein
VKAKPVVLLSNQMIKKTTMSLKIKLVPLEPIFGALFFGFSFFNAVAQKLPNVQTSSIRAPANIKIDGKITEWDNKFQAYNHATDIFYTVSNDDAKLYLTIQAADKLVINKIMSGGITFTIQKSDKKTDKGGISIIYPLFDKSKKPFVPPTTKASQGESMMNVYNKSLDASKYIGVTGIKTLDSLITVYNTDGVRVAELFDNKMRYTYELAIDLKLLGLQVNDASKFAYHISINPFIPDPTSAPAKPAPGLGAIMMDDGMSGSGATTDMWGEYILAK